MIKKIAIINSQSSFNTPTPRESLDLALIFAALDQQVTVIYLNDGVYQLLGGQQPEQINGKDFLSTMKAFDLYDIEQVIACSESVQQAGVNESDLNLPTEMGSTARIAQVIANRDQVVTL